MKRLLTAAAMFAVVIVPVAAGAAVSAPTNSSAPTISGTPYVGKELTAMQGNWSNGPTSFAYQWARCNSTGNNCSQISGATRQTYTPVSADVNNTLEVWVTASNSGGTTGPVSSKPTAVITPALAPTNTALPTVVGKPLVGETLVANTGSYSGGAVSDFAYQWQSCDPNTLLCNTIANAIGQNYTVVSGDVGKRLRVTVIASNPFGQTQNHSAATDAITAPLTRLTTTLNVSAATTICCQVVHLSGTTTPAQAGQQVTIIAHPYGALASTQVAAATTDASGNWTAKVTPMIATSYTAQTTTATSTRVTIQVHPRVGFGINGNNFSAKITGQTSFAGRVGFFQMLNANGRWHNLALVVINSSSVAHFHVALHRGHTYAVRIYLPQSQTGPGYLDGTSHTRRVGGSAL